MFHFSLYIWFIRILPPILMLPLIAKYEWKCVHPDQRWELWRVKKIRELKKYWFTTLSQEAWEIFLFIASGIRKISIKICDAQRDLVSFVEFIKREKQPWSSVTFNKVSITPPWVFFTFLKMVPNRATHFIK